MRDDFGSLFAASGLLRADPSPSVLAGGLPCGPFDQKLLNELFFTLSSLLSECNTVIDAAGIAPDETLTNQFLAAIRAVATVNAGAARIPFNTKSYENTTRYSLNTPGEVPVINFGTYTKQSATSIILAFLGAQSFVTSGASYGAAYLRLTVGSLSKVGQTNSFYTAYGGGPDALIAVPFVGLGQGAQSLGVAYGRGDGQTWTTIINPTSSDYSGLPPNTASRLLLLEIEP